MCLRIGTSHTLSQLRGSGKCRKCGLPALVYPKRRSDIVPLGRPGGRASRQPGQVRKEAAVTRFARVVHQTGLPLRFTAARSEEHTSELQTLMRTSHTVSRLKTTTHYTQKITSHKHLV